MGAAGAPWTKRTRRVERRVKLKIDFIEMEGRRTGEGRRGTLLGKRGKTPKTNPGEDVRRLISPTCRFLWTYNSEGINIRYENPT